MNNTSQYISSGASLLGFIALTVGICLNWGIGWGCIAFGIECLLYAVGIVMDND